VTPTHFTYAVDTLTRGATTPSYELGVEEAFMVIDGVLDLETFAGDGTSTIVRLGARDLGFVPAGVQHRLVNNDAATVRFGCIVGSKDGVPIAWERALTAASA
jgi:oxalate decarboxylase/phosphoglucose isomerase-like protein (cupin superfamily)